MDRLHLVKCYSGTASEEEWLRALFAPLEVVEESAPEFSVVRDHAIYVVIGSTGLAHVPQQFLERLGATRGKGLLHLGDEFLAGGYDLYRRFDFVVRNYYAAHLDRPGVLTLPLGLPNGSRFDVPSGSFADRAYAWSFLGTENAARSDMVDALSGVGPHYVHIYAPARRRALPKETYRRVLQSSLFVPCPMGNVMLETWRVYEALEAGAIPIVSRRAAMPYHDLVMPGHPLPAFSRWSDARRFLDEVLDDRAALEALHARVTSWWSETKRRLGVDLAEFVRRGFAGEYRDALDAWRPHTGAALQAWRVVELLKHHDAVAVRGRAATIARRTVARLAKRP